MWLPEVITNPYIDMERSTVDIQYYASKLIGTNEAHKRIKQLYKHAVEMGF